MGTVYSRKRSPYLWIKYYQHGRPVRESTGTKNEIVARRMLRAREGDVERGIPIDPKVGRVTFDEAAEDMLNDYKANRKRTLRRCEAADQQAPRAVLRQQAAVVDHARATSARTSRSASPIRTLLIRRGG